MFSTLGLVDLAKNRKNFTGALFRDIWVKVEKFKKHFKWVTRTSHLQFFDILRPLYPSTTAPKFIHFHWEINFLRKCAFLDLADFWLIFRFFERIEVCTFISRKLNKLRGPFFIFPDNFTHSILIAKKYPTWRSRFGGYSDPKSVSEAKIWKLTLFHAAPATKRLDSEVQWCFILYARGSSSKRPYQILNDPYNIAPRKLKLLHPKNLSPIFAKFSGVGAKFLRSLYGDAQGPWGKKFWQLYLGPLPGIRISKFRGKSILFRVTGNRCSEKTLTGCAGVPPISGPKFTPLGWRLQSFSEHWRKVRVNRGPPIESVNNQKLKKSTATESWY